MLKEIKSRFSGKMLIYSLFIMLFSVTFVYGQSWSNEVSLNFFIQSHTKVASFVDHNGVHIVYSRNGGIRYALVNSDGSVVKYDKTIEPEGAGTDFASIVADNDNLYAFYVKNNKINVAKSTNLGDSWNTSFSFRPLINTGIDHLATHLIDHFVHIVWSEERVGASYTDDSHYIRFNPTTSAWENYQNVTDVEQDGGSTPEVTVSTDRVNVSYILYDFDEPKTRDKTSSGWQTPQSVPFYNFPFVTNIRYTKPFITNNDLDIIYYADYSTINTSGAYIAHSYRDVNGSTWTKDPTYFGIDINHTEVVSDKTSDNKVHILYYDDLENDYVHRYVTGTTWSSVMGNIPLSSQSNSLSPNSNDLYLLTVYNPYTPSKIKFRHYDAAPLAPTNLTISKSQNNHPLLEWDMNKEPDIDYYTVYREDSYGGGLQYLDTSYDNIYEDETLSYCNAPPGGTCPNLHTYSYKVTAIDLKPNESDPSNVVEARLVGGSPSKIGADNKRQIKPVSYSLRQNYPNPFNPSTEIKYTLAEDSYVTLKIYDLLGKEVAVLVNGNKPAGNYTVEFNAVNLPSGVYIYRLTAGKFTAVKKLMLMK